MTKSERLAVIKSVAEARQGALQHSPSQEPKPNRKHHRPRANAPVVLPRSQGPHPALPGFVFNAMRRYWVR